jgi:hypothetical protein
MRVLHGELVAMQDGGKASGAKISGSIVTGHIYEEPDSRPGTT